MSAGLVRITALQMRPAPQTPVRWFLAQYEALFAVAEWYWTRDRAKAKWLPAERAELMVGAQRHTLPLLPTQPTPEAPVFPHIITGQDVRTPEQPAADVQAEPSGRPVPAERRTKDIPERIADARRRRRAHEHNLPMVDPAVVYTRTSQRLGERDGDES